MSKVGHGVARRFFDAHVDDETDECVIWRHSLRNGYGQISDGPSTAYVHILACERRHGPRPTPEAQAAHSCGNRRCFNGRHLRWTRHRDIHGAAVPPPLKRGEDVGTAKLTEDGVRMIRRRYAAGGVRLQDLAAEYGVCPSCIGHVVRRRNWAWLDPPSRRRWA